jgi:hypothetical protein
MKWQILALCLLFESIVANATSGNKSNKLSDMSFNGEPSYNILVHTSDPHLDPGDKFKIEIFISGAGDVDLSRISFSIPQFIVKARIPQVDR